MGSKGGRAGGAGKRGAPAAARAEGGPRPDSKSRAAREREKFEGFPGGLQDYYKLHGTDLDKWRASLSKAERNAIDEYSGSMFGGVNNHLLSGGRSYVTDEMKTMTKELDNAFNKSRLPSSAVVWRGLRGISDPAKFLGNKTVVLKGFNSTTLTKRVARENFADSGGLGAQGSVILKIRVPKGARALIPHKVSGALQYENEILLDRGTKIHIGRTRKITKGSYRGMYVAHATVVGYEK